MASPTSFKETVDEIIKKSPGMLRGSNLKAQAQYIEGKEGREGLKNLENKLTELGHPVKFKKIKIFEYYPVGLADIVIVVSRELFNWSDKDIFNLGNSIPKISFTVRLLMRYFLTPEKSLKHLQAWWRKHNTEGEIECKLDQKKKQALVRLKSRITNPLVCIFHAGFFLRIAQYMIKSKKMAIRETRCAFKGASVHEFLITW